MSKFLVNCDSGCDLFINNMGWRATIAQAKREGWKPTGPTLIEFDQQDSGYFYDEEDALAMADAIEPSADAEDKIKLLPFLRKGAFYVVG